METTRETVCARIMNVSVFSDMPEQRLDEIHQVTSFDASLQSVMKLVLEGWPADKHETPVRAVPYFDVHDCLSAVDGILLKGRSSCDSHGSEAINQEMIIQCPSRP